MLPVLFLDVKPGQRVLDMCASPGSKTTQALDFLLADASSSAGAERGLVVANDLDKGRAYMLVHRLTRNTLRSAVVTCGPGDAFPGLYDEGELHATNVFDRVLCDVPCSGDGTLRKNQALWKDWHIGQGLTLHATQLALALRSATLLKTGGTMVYSTCSFNPIENEAVVAELLRRAGGSLELVDVSSQLPQLVTRPGRTNWKLGWRSKSKSTYKGHLFKAKSEDQGDDSTTYLHDWFETYEQLPQELRGSRVLRSMFPPPASDPIAASLKRTMRLIPIDQNSGGFFVAVLRKTNDLPGDKQQGLPALQEDADFPPPPDYVCKLCGQQGHFMKNCAQFVPEGAFETANPPKAKKQKTESSETKEFTKKRETVYRPVGDDVWRMIQEFYGIEDATIKVNALAVTSRRGTGEH